MTRGRWGLAVLLLVLLAVTPAAAADGFSFSPPAGWTDLSATTSREKLEDIDPVWFDAIHAAHVVAVGVDKRPDSPTRGAMWKADVNEGSVEITPETLPRVFEKVRLASRSLNDIAIVDTSVRTVQGVEVGRAVIEQQGGGHVGRGVMYVLPGGDRTAMVLFLASPGQFSALVSQADATVQQTLGVEALAHAEAPDTRSGRLLRVAVWLLLACLVGGRRRKREAPGSPRRAR